VHRLAAAVGAVGLTLAFFLVLPLIQAIHDPPEPDRIVRAADTAALEPPEFPEEDDVEPEQKEEEPPPPLEEDVPPLDLSQLEALLDPGFGDGWMAGSLELRLDSMNASATAGESLFGLADLDQEPRPVFQPQPVLDARVRRKGGGKVWIVFAVDEQGRVDHATALESTDPVFEAPALTAVKKWRFEPGKRNGTPVRFRMRIPVTFPG
jgi:protein TonB